MREEPGGYIYSCRVDSRVPGQTARLLDRATLTEISYKVSDWKEVIWRTHPLPPCITGPLLARRVLKDRKQENDSPLNEQLLISKGSPQLFAILTPQPNNLGERRAAVIKKYQQGN